MNQINKFDIWFATFFNIGAKFPAPGTIGSLIGVGFSLFFRWFFDLFFDTAGWGYLFFCAIFLAIFSYLATREIKKCEKVLGHDHKNIIIDEIIGQMLVLIFFPINGYTYLIGFVCFRFFDIVKPGPIGWVDKNIKTPWGTLGDDLLAGGCSLLILLLFNLFFVGH